MKIIPVLALSVLTMFINSCADKTDYENLPVKLPTDPDHKPYYVKTTILNKQLYSKGSTFLKFEFNGSSIAKSKHNNNQAKAIAWATQQPNTSSQLFNITVYGTNATTFKRDNLIEFLAENNVKLRQFQPMPVKNSAATDTVENTFINKHKEAELVNVAIEKM